jgi:hypothetical protein
VTRRQSSDSSFELDAVIPPEDLEMLQKLMSIGHADRVEFMG